MAIGDIELEKDAETMTEAEGDASSSGNQFAVLREGQDMSAAGIIQKLSS